MAQEEKARPDRSLANRAALRPDPLFLPGVRGCRFCLRRRLLLCPRAPTLPLGSIPGFYLPRLLAAAAEFGIGGHLLDHGTGWAVLKFSLFPKCPEHRFKKPAVLLRAVRNQIPGQVPCRLRGHRQHQDRAAAGEIQTFQGDDLVAAVISCLEENQASRDVVGDAPLRVFLGHRFEHDKSVVKERTLTQQSIFPERHGGADKPFGGFGPAGDPSLSTKSLMEPEARG